MLSSRIDSLLRRSTEVKTLMLRPSSPRSILSLALLLLVLSPAAAAERGGLRLIFMPAPYQATESAEWRVPIKVINDLDDGLFGDSLWCETEDLDPGITGAGRRTRGSSNAISTVMKSLGEHDSTVVTFAGIANCEHARLTFHLFAHTASGEVHEGSGRCETAPSPDISLPCPVLPARYIGQVFYFTNVFRTRCDLSM